MVALTAVERATILANTGAYKVFKKLIVQANDNLLKNTRVYFSPGSGGFVFVRLLYKGRQWIPDTSITSLEKTDTGITTRAITGDDVTHPFYTAQRVRQSDVFALEAINLDDVDHDVVWFLEFHPLTKKKSYESVEDA